MPDATPMGATLGKDVKREVTTYTARGFGAHTAGSDLAPLSFVRREPLAQDVQIKILYCGVCHSDLHQVRDEWHVERFGERPAFALVGD